MKIIFYILTVFLFIACKNSTTKNLVISNKKDFLKTKETKLQIFLPEDHITKNEIDKSILETDKLIELGNLKTQRVEGLNSEPCLIIKYFQDSSLLQIEVGCGDCSNFMTSEKYYFKDNNLIFADKSYIDYGYNPCWSEQTCKEYGINQDFKEKHLKTRHEKYYFFEMGFGFKRTGNLNNSSYVKNDTLKPIDVLDDAIKYLNAY